MQGTNSYRRNRKDMQGTNSYSNELSYRHAVRGTRKGQWEKRPAYPKASKDNEYQNT